MKPYEKEQAVVRDLPVGMAYDGTQPFDAWQSAAREKLAELLGMDRFTPCEAQTQIEWEHTSEDFREIRFTFQSEPGYRVPCHLLIPHKVRKKGVMICLQGHSTGMHISLGRAKYEGDEKNIASGDRDFALQCVRHGMCCVTLEQRSFGERGGKPNPDCYGTAMTALLAGRTLLGARVWDVMRLVDVLRSDFSDRCDAEVIYSMGNSGGGTATFYAAALDTRIAAAMPSCAFCTYADSIGSMYHCACNFVPNIRRFFDMAELAAMIAPRPLVIVSGAQDDIFPIEGAKAQFARLKAYYTAADAADRCAHVVGKAGHRFYADLAWPVFLKLTRRDDMLHTLTAFSNRYGADPELVLAGGGNTSAKDGGVLYIKGSGTALATITADAFVAMDREKLATMWDKTYPEADDAREAAALADLMAAKLPGQEGKRPSVETLLHALFPQRYVLHLHPAAVNGLTCAVDGKAWAKKLFPDAVWIEASKPGYVLAKLCRTRMETYKAETGRDANVLLLQNHGVFFAADDAQTLDALLGGMLDTLRAQYTTLPDLSAAASEDAQFGARLAALYGGVYRFNGSAEAVRFSESSAAMAPLMKPFSPDHIVYCKAFPLYIERGTDADKAFADYRAQYGYAPKLCYVQGGGFYALGETDKQAQTAAMLALDAIKIAVYSRTFGGPLPQSDALTDFIVNWEVEAYRAKKAE